LSKFILSVPTPRCSALVFAYSCDQT